MTTLLDAQLATCKRFDAVHFPCSDDASVFLATSMVGWLPLNGERLNPGNGESGWYIWGGAEKRDDPNFFEKVSLSCLIQKVPLAQSFLGLPPGYRFFIAGGLQKAWVDSDLGVSPIEQK